MSNVISLKQELKIKSIIVKDLFSKIIKNMAVIPEKEAVPISLISASKSLHFEGGPISRERVF